MNKKLLSIILVFIFSVVIWVSVTLSDYYFITLNVPVKVVNLPQGYIAYSNGSKDVQLKLKGEGWKLAYLSVARDMEYTTSANLDSGTVNLNLSESMGENQWLSTGIQVLNVNPEVIPFRIEKTYHKKVKVFPDMDLAFTDSYGLTSPALIIPDSIDVTAPKSLLKSITSVPTEKIRISDINRNITERVQLKKNQYVSYNQGYVVFSLFVEKIVDKRFENVGIEIRNVPTGYSVSLFPDNLNVVLRGGINILGRMKGSDLMPFVNFESIYKDTTGVIIPNLDLPPYIQLVSTEPNYLKYIIKKY
jgi:hypothetical protein